MSTLKMPSKGSSATMLAELQAEHAAGEPDQAATARKKKEPKAAASSPPPPEQARDQRVAFALERAAADEATIITVRIPACLNHYIDEYVARRRSLDPKSKYRKQDAVAEAFAAFYADHPLPPAPPDQTILT